jgi:folate-dependent tRNA-U54 methylase TrmFO/GidA
MTAYTLFILGQALAPNIETLLVTRFFSGFFAVAPLTNAGGECINSSNVFFTQRFVRRYCGYLASSWTRSSHEPLCCQRLSRSRPWANRCRVVSSFFYSF